MYKEIEKCRICGNSHLDSIIHLGNQFLTGVFPKTKEHNITSGPLELVKCREDRDGRFCGLVQLKQAYGSEDMYGLNYGYRSALNQSMVEHLHQKVKSILERVSLAPGDIIIDVGSNDSTLLQAYPPEEHVLVGIDPTGIKFKEYYPDHIQLIPDFFSAESFKRKFGDKKAKIITSIAMFYDLEAPLDFMSQIYNILADDGIWVFEQSYLPAMLKKNAYDTICHEHAEYYRLKQIKWMTDKVGLKIVDVEFNEVNGGSFSIVAAKRSSPFVEKTAFMEKILRKEDNMGFGTLKPYEEFKRSIFKHRDQLRQLIEKIKSDNQLVLGYGASTKGNVILQFCDFTEKDIPFIAEINEDKFGCVTPGTGIPIISEAEARALNPDYFLVLPWHFRDNILNRERKYLESGGKFLFPLPEIEVVSK